LIEEQVSAFGEGDLVAKMATRDVALLLAYMYKNSDKIVESKDWIHQHLARSLKEKEEELEKKMNKNKKETSNQKEEKKSTDKKETSN
jgi:hypothetical protein